MRGRQRDRRARLFVFADPVLRARLITQLAAAMNYAEPPKYVEPSDQDVVAYLLGEAVAHRNTNPAIACALARKAKAIADRDHAGYAAMLPGFEKACPTHDERIWDPPVSPAIIAKLCAWSDWLISGDR